MRKLVFIVLVSFLLVAVAFVRKGNIPAVKAASSIYQGDLILTGNNVTIIEGRFDINGSILIEDNATLILRDAVLNFTQLYSYEFRMNLQNPFDGNPRLIVDNATMTSSYSLYVQSYANSSIEGNRLLPSSSIRFFAHDDSLISLSNSSLYELHAYDSTLINTADSYFEWLIGEGHSNITATNCTLVQLRAGENATFVATDCTISYDIISEASSVNCSINQLQSGFVGYWNFGLNSSVIVAAGGWAPNVTLLNSNVFSWSFLLRGLSNATIANCKLNRLGSYDYAVVSVYNSTNDGWASAKDFSSCFLYDTAIDMVEAHDNATSWLVNSTYERARLYNFGMILVSWYLDVHVRDAVDQDVPFASVTAYYPNASVSESELTGIDGWARLTLIEKMMNETGEYPVGNYTVEAIYDIYSADTSVNMTGTQEITLKLGFIIPEFPSFLILPLFMIATLLTVIVFNKKTG